MDDRHLGGELREERRLFHRRVAPTDDDELSIAEEEAVARGAGGDASPAELLLARDGEPFRRRPRGDHHGPRLPDLVARPDAIGPCGEIDAGHVDREDLRAEPGGLLLHLVHQLRPQDPVGEARIVLDVGGQHQLAAGLHALEHQRLEVGPGGVERRRESGRAGPDHDHVPNVALAFRGHAMVILPHDLNAACELVPSRECPSARRSDASRRE